MTISLPSTVNDESRIQSLFPLCILIARPVYSPAVVEVVFEFGESPWISSIFMFHFFVFFFPVYAFLMQDSAVYQFSRECILTKCTGDDRMSLDEASFILPEITKLSAEVKSGSLSILFISCGRLLLFPLRLRSVSPNAFGENIHNLILFFR